MAVKVGDRVRIKNSVKYGGRVNGLIGTVRSIYLTSVGVAVDDFYNKQSDYGWYYFTSKQLEKLTDEGVIKMDGNYRIALIKFLDGQNTDKAYEYACYDNLLATNDKVVVKSAHHGYGVGIITDFVENVGQDVIREIICYADFSRYENRIAARKRRDELRKEMAKKAAQMQEIALYKMLAQDDPAMADLVKEYTELLNGN